VFAIDLHSHTRFFHGRPELGATYDPYGFKMLAWAAKRRGLHGLATTNHDYYREFDAPDDFVVIPGGPYLSGEIDPRHPEQSTETLPDFAIKRHSVTCGEYLTFLNDLAAEDLEQARERMVEQLAQRERFDDSTLAAMEAVPRHEFVPVSRRDRAYEDRPLPIGNDQTISAPHMVAAMTELLDLDPGERVLEIGTGCGYHAAVTAELVGGDGVHSVEYHESLARKARERLAELGYGDVSVRAGDGRKGWPERGPYDRAYLTCAAAELPDGVVEQVRPGGYVLAPVGTGQQTLLRARRRADGSLDRETHGGVRFVRMQ